MCMHPVEVKKSKWQTKRHVKNGLKPNYDDFMVHFTPDLVDKLKVKGQTENIFGIRSHNKSCLMINRRQKQQGPAKTGPVSSLPQ